jgi:hypothetical protein
MGHFFPQNLKRWFRIFFFFIYSDVNNQTERKGENAYLERETIAALKQGTYIYSIWGLLVMANLFYVKIALKHTNYQNQQK